jgi:hypothetical protein
VRAWIISAALLCAAVASAQRVEPSRDETWRAVKKGIEADFQPAPASLLRTDKVRALARQVTRATPSSTPPSREGFQTPNAGSDDVQRELWLTDQIRNAQDACERPAGERSVLVEVRIDEKGRASGVRVPPGASSGDRTFDDAAVGAVTSALARHQARLAGVSEQLARFKLSATRTVRTLRIDPVLGPLPTRSPRGLAIPIRFGFEETTGRVEPIVPFTENVKTQVELLSVEPFVASE